MMNKEILGGRIQRRPNEEGVSNNAEILDYSLFMFGFERLWCELDECDRDASARRDGAQADEWDGITIGNKETYSYILREATDGYLAGAAGESVGGDLRSPSL